MQLRDSSLCIAILTAAASGCVSGGRTSYDAMVRDYHATETQMRAVHAHDEPTFGSAPLDRGALVREVLNRNPSTEAARQAWRAALARYRQAGAYEDPMVMASIAPLSIASSKAPVGYELGISQKIPLGGKIDAQATLAAAEAETAQCDYEKTRIELALTASQLYDDYFVAVRSMEINDQHAALVTALKQSAASAYASGRGALQDSLQADAELARLEYQKIALRGQRDVVVAQLNALLHREPDATLPEPPAELPLRDVAPESSAELKKEIERRPDITSAQARVRVQEARIGVAESGYYPDLIVSTSYTSMWDMPEHRWMAGVAINLPLQRSTRQAAVEEATAERSASESEVEHMVVDARAEAAVAQRRVEQAREGLSFYEQRLVPVARDQVDAARAGFIGSQNGFFAVIDAERNLRSAEFDLQMMRAELGKRIAELDRALGRVPGLDGQEVRP